MANKSKETNRDSPVDIRALSLLVSGMVKKLWQEKSHIPVAVEGMSQFRSSV